MVGEDDKDNETVLARKLRKLVESQVENDPEMKEALEELSTFFFDNTLSISSKNDTMWDDKHIQSLKSFCVFSL